MTIAITPHIEERLRVKAAQEGQAVETLAERLILSALDAEAQEQAETIAAFRRNEQAALEGRERPLSEFIAHQRQKHGLPSAWPQEVG